MTRTRTIAATLATTITALACAGTAHAATEKANDNWGTVSRNVIGSATAIPRVGPPTPPAGVGSIQLDVADGASKLAYGNEVDYLGDPLDAITALGFSVFTTGENVAISPANLPGIGLEIDPTGAADATAPNYSTLVSVPTALPANQWSSVDAAAGEFFLTGAAGTASGCNQATYCTLDEVKAAYPAATLLSVQITKGRDYAFHGAVDALVLNDTTIDLGEPITGPGGTNGLDGKPGTQGPSGGPGPKGQDAPPVTCTSSKVVRLRSRVGASSGRIEFLDAGGNQRVKRMTFRGKDGRLVGKVSLIGKRAFVGSTTRMRVTSVRHGVRSTVTRKIAICG